jgi:mono/diheme cytochrome c family protein
MRRLLPIILISMLPACRQDMADQPAYRPFRASSFFADGLSARPLVPGTVARGSKQSSGKRPTTSEDVTRIVGIIAASADNPFGAAGRAMDWSVYREAFPISITQATLERGQQRFNIYCAMCHDRVGTGKGVVVERGFTAPPSFHSDWSRGFKLKGADLKLKDAPVGYYFEVITHGFGAMPEYADQIAPDDRWAIVAYVRALQLSQHMRFEDVGDETAKARLTANKGARP